MDLSVAIMGNALRLALLHLVADTDRHGNVRHYYRAPGKRKIRLHGEPGTVEFLKQYNAAVEGKIEPAQRRQRAKPETFRWLCEQHFADVTDFGQLDKRTQYVRRGILEGICQSKTKSGKERGSAFFAEMLEEHVREIIEEKLTEGDRPKPGAANNRLRALRALFKWAKKRKHVSKNPTIDVESVGTASEGFRPWEAEQVAQFEQQYPIGTKARLAFALLRYTGVRRSDVVRLGPGMIRLGIDEAGDEIEELHFTPTKGSRRKRKPGQVLAGPKVLKLPVLPQLRAVLDATSLGKFTFLVTEYGRSFTVAGFGNRFRDWCDDAGLKGYSAHGVRKFDATEAAVNGATTHQLMAMFGWDSIKQAEIYTKNADQKRLAGASMHFLTGKQREQKIAKIVPLSSRVRKSGTSRQK